MLFSLYLHLLVLYLQATASRQLELPSTTTTVKMKDQADMKGPEKGTEKCTRKRNQRNHRPPLTLQGSNPTPKRPDMPIIMVLCIWYLILNNAQVAFFMIFTDDWPGWDNATLYQKLKLINIPASLGIVGLVLFMHCRDKKGRWGEECSCRVCSFLGRRSWLRLGRGN